MASEGGGAWVLSIEQLETFRASLAKFQEEAKAAITSADLEVRRALQWLHQDQPSRWNGEIRRTRQELAEARTTLTRKRIATAEGPPRDTLEREALQAAERRLRHAEDQLAKVKRWIPLLERAVQEYQGQSRPLAETLTHSVDEQLHHLSALIHALQRYLDTAGPRSVFVQGTTSLPTSSPPPTTASPSDDPPPSSPPLPPDADEVLPASNRHST